MHKYEEKVIIREFCDELKRCMDLAHELANGGKNIPLLVEQFDLHVTKLQNMLSKGSVAKLIDDELKNINDSNITDLHDIDSKKLLDLVSMEFKHCSYFKLDRFVTTKSILRSVRDAASIPEKGDFLSSKKIADLLAKNATSYQQQLTKVRESASAPAIAKASSPRIAKKKVKRQIFSGIYNTLAGIAFIACNTPTYQMKTSASFASEHFKAANQQLFG